MLVLSSRVMGLARRSFPSVGHREVLVCLALTLSACSRETVDAESPVAATSPHATTTDDPTHGKHAAFDQTPSDKSETEFSAEELHRLDEITAAASGDSAPFSECQRHVSLGLWSDRVKRHQEHPTEEDLKQLEQRQGSEPEVAEFLARETFDLSQAALRDLLVDALKPSERRPARTRVLLTNWERLKSRAEVSLARAAGLKLRRSAEYAYQLAFLSTQDAQWEDALGQLRSLVEQKDASPSIASRSHLLLGVVQLTLTPTELDRALPHFVSVETSGAAPNNPIVLSSHCYRAEIAAAEGNKTEAN